MDFELSDDDRVLVSSPRAREPHARVGEGVYLVTLYGRGGAELYRAIFQERAGFEYVCPAYHGGMVVYGFSISWIPT